MRRSAAQIRQQFIDFFCQRAGHTFVPSSPVVPHDDPTLLFTNAGMNQFKDVFLGSGTRPYARAVNSQKCIRAGGKHNDLEDVGKDTYHHTFFEMLGNWSFGDYFKAEAIQWAWELLTQIWGLDPQRLHATYFEGDAAEHLQPDTEARDLWLRHLPPERVHPGNKKDNFWEMGESGPCGPCSEIHYDGTDEVNGGPLVNKSDARVIEIWNLVFIQFNRASEGRLNPLPAKHVDTGMGFERIVRVLQHKQSNYDTDIWLPIFNAIEGHTGAHAYRGRLNDPVDVAYRVIADHVRCLTMAISDGARPSNEGRGYVLRRILRRAVRHAHQTLGVRGELLHTLVPSVVDSLGEAFPEIRARMNDTARIIRDEEEAFLRTMDRGLELFEEAARRARDRSVSASDAFQLHDTYGFPIDLTRVMAEERGMTVDETGFEALMEEARHRSRGGASAESADARQMTLPPEAIARLRAMNIEPTIDIDKYHGRPTSTMIKAIWNGADFDDDLDSPGHNDLRAIIVERTNFYAEAGGQIGDTGTIVDVDNDASSFEVVDTKSFGGYVLHVGRLTRGDLRVGEQVQMLLDSGRRARIRSNHTATHLLNLALRSVLGEEINQRGSLVADDRLRFDFSHGHALSQAQIEEVNAVINAAIHRALPVFASEWPLAEAKRIRGVRAVFGERYPDPVRVVSIGPSSDDLAADPHRREWQDTSIEFCGGTHVASTDEIGRCAIIAEQALAAGVRRVIALTGPAAQAAEQAGQNLMERANAADHLNDEEFLAEFEDLTRHADELTIPAAWKHRVHSKLESMRQRTKALRKTAESATRDNAVEQARQMVERMATSEPVIVEHLQGANKDALLAAMDVVRARRPDAATMLFSGNLVESKVFIVASVPPPLVGQGLKAGDWVKKAATICGGSGGGRPDMAQAGGKDPSQIDKAISEARSYARGLLKN